MGEPRLTDEQWGQIETHMAEGQMDQAVAKVKEFTGCSLPEARDILDNYDKEAWADPPEGLSIDQRRQINRLLAAHRDEEAVQLVTQWTNRDMAGAREFLDQQYAVLEKLDPGRFPPRKPGA